MIPYLPLTSVDRSHALSPKPKIQGDDTIDHLKELRALTGLSDILYQPVLGCRRTARRSLEMPVVSKRSLVECRGGRSRGSQLIIQLNLRGLAIVV